MMFVREQHLEQHQLFCRRSILVKWMDGWMVGWKLDRKIRKSKGMNRLLRGWMDCLLGTSSGLKFALSLFPYVSVFYCQRLSHFRSMCPAHFIRTGLPEDRS